MSETTGPPDLLELWRVDPPGAAPVERLVVTAGMPALWCPPPDAPWTWPGGWPNGYEWRRYAVDGREIGRRPVDPDRPEIAWSEPGIAWAESNVKTMLTVENPTGGPVEVKRWR